MNGYPKVFNIESDPHEKHNIGEMYEWVIGPALKAVEEYKASASALRCLPGLHALRQRDVRQPAEHGPLGR
jgi:hypothetical protein